MTNNHLLNQSLEMILTGFVSFNIKRRIKTIGCEGTAGYKFLNQKVSPAVSDCRANFVTIAY